MYQILYFLTKNFLSLFSLPFFAFPLNGNSGCLEGFLVYIALIVNLYMYWLMSFETTVDHAGVFLLVVHIYTPLFF